MNKYGLNLHFDDKNSTQQSVSLIESENVYETLKLSHLKQLFDDMDEIVYAIDMDTYELVYMNRLQLSILGYQRLEDALGKTCYKVLQETLHHVHSVRMKSWKQQNSLAGHIISLSLKGNFYSKTSCLLMTQNAIV